MTRPTKHPKTGIYRLRLLAPPHLREAAKAILGVGHELIVSLKTKDEREARLKAPAALASLHARLAAVQAAAEGRPVELTESQVSALAGAWYRAEVAKWPADPGTVKRWEDAATVVGWQAEQVDEAPDGPDHPGYRWEVTLSDDDRQDATRVISEAGLPLTPSTVQRVGEAIWQAKLNFFQVMQRRAEGDWRPDPNLERFPPLPIAHSKQLQKGKEAGLEFDAVLSGWARDHGWTLDAKPIPRPLYDRKRTLDRLADFLGHKDATKVTKADAVRWKEDMQARGLAVATVRNDLSEMSALWRHALRQGKLGDNGVNPFEGIAPPKPKRPKKERRAFTDEEAAAILTAARGQKGYMRWLPWVCCLTGARLSEVCQGFKEDVAEDDGVPALRIHDEGADDEDGVRSVKNPDSKRTVPLHPALIAEGFLDYVRALPARSPLFPDAKPDAMFGLRATNAGKKMSRWLKQDLGITDRRISPNHSWRHWFTDACRKVSMHPEVRSALTGHSAKMDESANYGEGMKSFPRVLAAAIATVRLPLPPKGAPG